MEIKLSLWNSTADDLNILVGAMVAAGRLRPSRLADIAAALGGPQQAEEIGTMAREVASRAHSLEVDELTTLIAALNKELYSRRALKPEDNPASGVEKAALNSDAAGLTGGTLGEMERQLADKAAQQIHDGVKTIDLAAVFGAANADTEIVTLKVDNATADAIKANPDGAAQALAAAAQLDKNGLPWDARIHAASKAINADGTWRQKRGVADALVTTVEAELRQVMSVPLPQAVSDDIQDYDPNEVLGGEGPKVVPPPPPIIVEARAAGSPPEWVGQVTPPAPPAPAGDPTNFPELVTFIAAQKVAGKLTQDQVSAALKEIGIEGALPVIAARLDIIPALVAKLRAIGGV